MALPDSSHSPLSVLPLFGLHLGLPNPDVLYQKVASTSANYPLSRQAASKFKESATNPGRYHRSHWPSWLVAPDQGLGHGLAEISDLVSSSFAILFCSTSRIPACIPLRPDLVGIRGPILFRRGLSRTAIRRSDPLQFVLRTWCSINIISTSAIRGPKQAFWLLILWTV